MKNRWITYFCPSGHGLIFGHSVNKKGKFESASPTVCGCGKIYNYAAFGFITKQLFDF